MHKADDKLKALQDKKIVEALIQRLNDKIAQDPKLAKKAADILSNWMTKIRK